MIHRCRNCGRVLRECFCGDDPEDDESSRYQRLVDEREELEQETVDEDGLQGGVE